MRKWQEVRTFLLDEEGATATEYSVMLALVLAVIIVTVAFLGLQVEGALNDFVTLYESVTN